MSRIEFGVERQTCGCNDCSDPCRFMPGFLIPSDLGRLIPPDTLDVLKWAEEHLLASTGATLMDRRTGQPRQIPTLVPASKSQDDPSCLFLDRNRRCTIHAIAPFGCAFFRVCDHDPKQYHLSVLGHLEVEREWNNPESLYRTIWDHLVAVGRISLPALEKRARMDAALERERRQDRKRT